MTDCTHHAPRDDSLRWPSATRNIAMQRQIKATSFDCAVTRGRRPPERIITRSVMSTIGRRLSLESCSGIEREADEAHVSVSVRPVTGRPKLADDASLKDQLVRADGTNIFRAHFHFDHGKKPLPGSGAHLIL